MTTKETLLEKREIIASYPHEKFAIPSWYPAWPDGGDWDKSYILSNLDYMILQVELGNESEYLRLKKDYGDLIRQAVIVAKKEKVGN